MSRPDQNSIVNIVAEMITDDPDIIKNTNRVTRTYEVQLAANIIANVTFEFNEEENDIAYNQHRPTYQSEQGEPQVSDVEIIEIQAYNQITNKPITPKKTVIVDKWCGIAMKEFNRLHGSTEKGLYPQESANTNGSVISELRWGTMDQCKEYAKEFMQKLKRYNFFCKTLRVSPYGIVIQVDTHNNGKILRTDQISMPGPDSGPEWRDQCLDMIQNVPYIMNNK